MKRACTWIHLTLAAALALGCGGLAPSTEGLHQACTPGMSECASGQSCLEYTGLAGQPISSCEIPCDYPSDCPEPLQCTAVADGPGEPTCH